MKQPTREEITQKIEKVLDGSLTREAVCMWAMDYIENDDLIDVDDLKAWHYLVAVSSIDLMIAPDKYLFCEEDIRDTVKKYK